MGGGGGVIVSGAPAVLGGRGGVGASLVPAPAASLGGDSLGSSRVCLALPSAGPTSGRGQRRGVPHSCGTHVLPAPEGLAGTGRAGGLPENLGLPAMLLLQGCPTGLGRVWGQLGDSNLCPPAVPGCLPAASSAQHGRELGTSATRGVGAELGVPVPGGRMSLPAPGMLLPASRGKDLACPVALLCPAAHLRPPAQLALTPHSAQLPTGRQGVPSIPGSQPDARTVLQLPLSPQGCLHHIPLSSSRSSAWIPLPVWPRQGKAGFYGRRPTPFLPSRGARHRLPPHRLCQGWWVLQAAAQPVVTGGVEKNSWQPRGTGCPCTASPSLPHPLSCRPAAGLAWEKPSPGMGSAKEPEGLQLLSRQAGAEDTCEPSASSPGCPPVGECLPGSGCAAGSRAMRTCCVAELEAQGTMASPAVEKVPSPTGPAPSTLLPDAGVEPSVAAVTGSCGGPSGVAPACGPVGMGVPSTQKENTAPVPPLPEPCLKAPSKDMGSVPAPAKHVAFVEPAVGTGAAELPSQEQPQDGTGTSLGAAPQLRGSEAPKHPQGGTADPAGTGTAGSGGQSEAGLSPAALGQGRAEGSPAQGADAGSSQQPRTAKLLCESYSFKVTPPQDAGMQDTGTQVDSRASLVSVALSPMSPPAGLCLAEEAPEPIREVSWDEKGMTWEVYGASMEVEVLGMAIQKHLEKQIEEHGRQVVMTPQSTRAGSVKGAPRKGEAKRQPSIFRALLQNVRRPRCCSRTGPAME
uniref:G protein-regulated inducer of neurite outgrowth C-terminal domain-containing protein n=1 Tax=Aquila chrysaetos chrysaetos TaxID=223781 RepID=A0A663FI93_AQUCH